MKKVKFSTSDVSKYVANKLVQETRKQVHKSKKRKKLEKKSDWYYRGY